MDLDLYLLGSLGGHGRSDDLSLLNLADHSLCGFIDGGNGVALLSLDGRNGMGGHMGGLFLIGRSLLDVG